MKKIVALVLVLGLTVVPSVSFAAVSISLVGGPVVVEQGQPYVEPGYSADSTVDGDITGSVVVTGTDTSVSGDFTVTYSVTDSVLDSATAFRDLAVTSPPAPAAGGSSGTQPYCSGPTAPGWTVGLVGGGCGGTEVFIYRGESIVKDGVLIECPSWYPGGCVVR